MSTFTIKDVDFMSDNYGVEPYLYNWPMIYILENGKQAYVGQTTSIMKRMAQHKASDEKQIFKKAHFIYSKKFNQSVTFDYESRLIGLMAADHKFTLTNQNVGVTGIEYFDKDTYDQDFKELWRDLQHKDLALKSIDELYQSDLFRYSPYKELNDEQRKLVDEITFDLKRDLHRKIVVNGMPGSGKSIMAIYLFKLLKEMPEFRDLKIGMVVPPTALRKTFSQVFKTINGLSAKDVIGPSDVAKGKYDILLVDEAHRLKKRVNLSSYASYDNTCQQLGLNKTSTQLDWVLKQTTCAILFYDADQIVGPAGLHIESLVNRNLADRRMTAYYTLYSQMRCKGGVAYLQAIRNLLHGTQKEKIQSTDYELKLVDKFDTFENLYRQKEADAGLTRMVAGYAWEWISKNDPTKRDIVIEGHQKKWNSVLENWVHSANATEEVGCIHSTQGYDLNYGFVIIGPDLSYDPSIKGIYADLQNYYDRYGKNNATEAEVEEYIKNIYYVLMSRGIRGTYVYVCDPELREYMGKYLERV